MNEPTVEYVAPSYFTPQEAKIRLGFEDDIITVTVTGPTSDHGARISVPGYGWMTPEKAAALTQCLALAMYLVPDIEGMTD